MIVPIGIVQKEKKRVMQVSLKCSRWQLDRLWNDAVWMVVHVRVVSQLMHGWMDVLKETRKVIASRKPPHDVLEVQLRTG